MCCWIPHTILPSLPLEQLTIVYCDNFYSMYVLFKSYLIDIVLWFALLRTMLMFLTNIRFVTFNTNLCQLRLKTMSAMPLVPLPLTLPPLLLRNTDDIIETCLLCDGRNVIISVLGPLLFLIYINDLEKGIKSKIKFFADATSLFSIVTDPTFSAVELNHELNLIAQWAQQWKM